MSTKIVNGVTIELTPEEEAARTTEVNANISKWANYKAQFGYKDKRKAEYPQIADQLDMLWHSMDTGEIPKSSEFYTAIKTIKNKYPKPA